MKRLTFISFLLFFSILFSFCKKEKRTCLKSAGEKTLEKIIIAEGFNQIEIYDNLNLKLIEDSINFIELETYKNLRPFIKHYVQDSILILKDLNRCNFLRKYNKQSQITLHYKKIRSINLLGNGKIESLSPITNDIVHFYAHSSNSTINLSVNTNSLVVKFINGTVDGTISGNALSANIFHFGYSKVDFEPLVLEYLYLENKSDADVTVTVQNEMTLNLLSLGNIYYHGSPFIHILKNRYNSKVVQL